MCQVIESSMEVMMKRAVGLLRGKSRSKSAASIICSSTSATTDNYGLQPKRRRGCCEVCSNPAMGLQVLQVFRKSMRKKHVCIYISELCNDEICSDITRMHYTCIGAATIAQEMQAPGCSVRCNVRWEINK